MAFAAEDAGGGPGLEVALCGGVGDADVGGDGEGFGGGELLREAVVQELLAGAALGGGLFEVFAGEFAPDAEGVAEEDGGDGHGGAVVFLVADDGGREFAGVHQAEGGEDEGDAEGDEAEAADGGDDVVAEEAGVLGLGCGVPGVEVLLLVLGEDEFGIGPVEKGFVEVEVALSQGVEDGVEGAGGAAGKDVDPDGLEVQVVENEAGEEAVFGVGDEGGDLPGRSGKDGGEARPQELDEFPVLAAGVGYGLVVEGLAKAVGVVAEVGLEGDGKGVALGLEEEAAAVVVAQDLVEGGGAGVGGDDEGFHLGEFWHRAARVFALFDVVLYLVGLVGGHFFVVLVPQLLVDGLDEAPAEGEAAFAGGGLGGDVEEEVCIDAAVAIDAVDGGDDGGEGDDGPEDEKICIGVGDGVGGDGFQELREVAAELGREGGQRLGLR